MQGLKMGWAKSDTVNIVSTVNSVDRNFGVYGVVVDDIKVLYSEVGVLNCQALSRVRNGLSHTLASQAFSSIEDKLWLNCWPDKSVLFSGK
ncbi:hypothetical protein ACOSP7_007849 [Xanthoceras sorbifolium]